MMSNDLTNPLNAGVPDYLRDMTKHEKIGNLDESDRIVPRVQLLQAISPEVTEYDNAKPGNFWHNLAAENLGPKLVAVPIIMRKSMVLWAPRGDERGILARSNDCAHWDQPNMEWTVKPKNSPKPVIWRTRGSVAESGLDKFGSSVPEDPNSVPAASLTYNTLWVLPEFIHYSPVVIINTRSSLKPTQQLYNRIDLRPVAHYAQQWEVGIVQEKGAEGPYFNYTYKAAGYPTQEIAEYCRALYNRYREMNWVPSDERETDPTDGRNGGGGGTTKHVDPDMASKF
jgi:hypothetical protein